MLRWVVVVYAGLEDEVRRSGSDTVLETTDVSAPRPLRPRSTSDGDPEVTHGSSTRRRFGRGGETLGPNDRTLDPCTSGDFVETKGPQMRVPSHSGL